MVVRRLTAGKLLMEGRFDPTLRSEIDG
jgi:hypothetical protein